MAEKELFYSFEDALRELRLKPEELKRLVSEGEIRAFREGETMKLRKSDVENLRSELSGGEVVDLGVASEELVFEDDTDLDAGMATEEISAADTLLEEDVEDVGEVELVEETTTRSTTRASRPGAAPVRRSSTVTTAAMVETEEEGVGMRVVLLLTTLVLILATPVVLSAGSGRVTDVAAGIAGLFTDVPR
ncbi:MAG TPA: helix-turn-helix domain-containing protein [Planctomycetota bacterium]|nr:helix-turn-helix domain-containing protein [Planctomycetota bacterium]